MRVLSFLILILAVFFPVLSGAVHERTPDMEHGESVTSETPLVPGMKVGGGDITFEVKDEGNITFSHNSHVSSAMLKCTDCHDKLFITKAKHKKVSMAMMRKGNSCGACHDGKKAFDVKGNCGNCHKK